MGADITIRRGGRLAFTVERAHEDGISATFIMQMGSVLIEVTEDYDSEGIAHFDIGSPDTDVVGVYEYQINENFASGSPDIYPSQDDCDGDCDLPTIEICESLPMGDS